MKRTFLIAILVPLVALTYLIIEEFHYQQTGGTRAYDGEGWRFDNEIQSSGPAPRSNLKILEENLDPSALSPAFLQYAFSERYTWVKMARKKNMEKFEWDRKIIRRKYPIPDMSEFGYGPETILPDNRLTKWNRPNRITITVAGNPPGDETPSDTFEHARAIFESEIKPKFEKLPFEINFVPPQGNLDRRSSTISADITLRFTSWGSGISGSPLWGTMFIDDRKSFEIDHDVYDQFQIFIETEIDPTPRYPNLPPVPGLIFLEKNHDIDAVVCNYPTRSSAHPTFKVLYSCIISGLGLANYTGPIDTTALDVTMLRILYDPRLKSGMTKEEAEPIVREIIEDLFYE